LSRGYSTKNVRAMTDMKTRYELLYRVASLLIVLSYVLPLWHLRVPGGDLFSFIVTNVSVGGIAARDGLSISLLDFNIVSLIFWILGVLSFGRGMEITDSGKKHGISLMMISCILFLVSFLSPLFFIPPSMRKCLTPIGLVAGICAVIVIAFEAHVSSEVSASLTLLEHAK